MHPAFAQFGELQSLVEIDAEANNLADLPASFGRCSLLSVLNFYSNPLRHPPLTVVKQVRLSAALLASSLAARVRCGCCFGLTVTWLPARKGHHCDWRVPR